MTPDPEPLASVRVEAYLDQILVPLARNLSAFYRDELRRELRAHLWERVDAYRELGYADEDAVTEALKQFGGAGDFARQWRQEWMKMPSRLTLRDVYDAGRLALRPALLGLTAACLPFGIMAWAVTHLHFPLSQTEVAVGTTFLWILIAFGVGVLPLSVGIRQGRRTPGRAGVGVTAALTAETLLANLLYLLADLIWPGREVVDTFFMFLLFMSAAWIPIAGGAAAISGWLTRRRMKRRQVT